MPKMSAVRQYDSKCTLLDDFARGGRDGSGNFSRATRERGLINDAVRPSKGYGRRHTYRNVSKVMVGVCQAATLSNVASRVENERTE